MSVLSLSSSFKNLYFMTCFVIFACLLFFTFLDAVLKDCIYLCCMGRGVKLERLVFSSHAERRLFV